MKPLNPQEKFQSYKKYTLSVRSQENSFDQKRDLINLLPGHHLAIKVDAQMKSISDALKDSEINVRGCKLPHENTGFSFLQNYTKIGCEVECAIRLAMDSCKCLPWFYKTDFEKIKTCDMFGSTCFDNMMANEENYKNCSMECLPDCQSIPFTTFSSLSPINMDDVCNDDVLDELKNNKQNHWFKLDVLDFFTGKSNDIPWYFNYKEKDDLGKIRKACETFVSKYVSYVTIEALNNEVMLSTKELRVTFTDQLAMIGGTLGLFAGISVLSFVEIGCLIMRLLRHTLTGTHLKKPRNGSE